MTHSHDSEGPGVAALPPQIDRALAACFDRARYRRVLIGFSGGGDSTALLLAVQQYTRTAGLSLEMLAIHVDHALQASSVDWAQHCRDLCCRLGVQCVVERTAVPPHGNLEANARAARYEAFARHMAAGDLLLLGHHHQDQVETILQRLFSGRGMLPMRSHGRLGDGSFARPLLSVPVAALREYVSARGERWVEDGSNLDTRFDRNFLRHEVVPLLAGRWRMLQQAVERVGHMQRDSHAALEHAVRAQGHPVPVSALPEAAGARLAWLRAFAHARGVFDTTDRALADFDARVRAGQAAVLACGDGASLRIYRGQLYCVPAGQLMLPPDTRLSLGQHLDLGVGVLSLQHCQRHAAGAFVYPGPMRVEPRQGGEQICCGATARTRRVKTLLARSGLPPWERAQFPLLLHNDELVCVPGIAVQTRFDARWADAGPDTQFCTAHWRLHVPAEEHTSV